MYELQLLINKMGILFEQALFLSFSWLLPDLLVTVLDVNTVCCKDRVLWRSPFSYMLLTNFPQSLGLIRLKQKPFRKISAPFLSSDEVCCPSPPPPSPKKKETAETDYTIELHKCCSLDSSINSLYIHFCFAFRIVSIIIQPFYGAEDCSYLARKLVIKLKLSVTMSDIG